MSNGTHTTNSNNRKPVDQEQDVRTLQHKQLFATRKKAEMTKLRSVYGVTWNLQRGKILIPLGDANMMVISNHGEFSNYRETVSLRCISGHYRVKAQTVVYNRLRMSHDFGLTPVPGATGKRLDPRPDDTKCAKGQYPKGSWVSLALHLDRSRQDYLGATHTLPVIPTMPRFLAAYRNRDELPLAATPALRELVELPHLSDEDFVAEAAVKVAWAEQWLAPQTGINSTNFWMIDSRFVSNLANASRIFEDFSDLRGMQYANPATDLLQLEAPNPVEGIASRLKVDLGKCRSIIDQYEATHSTMAATEEEADDKAYDHAYEQLQEVLQKMRESLGSYSSHFQEAELLQYMFDPKTPLKLVLPDLKGIPKEDVLRNMRTRMNTLNLALSYATTDDALMEAAYNPHQPLWCEHAAKMQVLYCNPDVSAEDAFKFMPADIGNQHVTVNLWPESEYLTSGNSKKAAKSTRTENEQVVFTSVASGPVDGQ